MLGPNAELVAASKEFFARGSTRRRVMDPDVVQVYAPRVLTIEPSHICAGTVCFQHDGHAVQVLVPRVKDVTAHASDRRAEQAVER